MDITDGVIQPAAGSAQEDNVVHARLHGGAECQLRIGLILFRLVLLEGNASHPPVFFQKFALYRIEITNNGIRPDIQAFNSGQPSIHGDHHIKFPDLQKSTGECTVYASAGDNKARHSCSSNIFKNAFVFAVTSPLKIAEPATKMLAPASIRSRTLSHVTPPST